ncbi:MAG: type I DNA topoisomerase [Minisyncoccales bacterium]
MNLILVESPTKSRTLEKFLKNDFKIMATFGHLRDLPKTTLGIDLENNFSAKYQVLKKAKNNLEKIKKEAKNAQIIFLATDPDREGEKIAFDIVETLKIPEEKYQRIVFHEITPKALKEALEKPRKIDLKLVSAQETRRILDRLVGYKLSPFLWQKIAKKLSAGRVQSVALWLIVEREKEIKNFLPQEYWTLEALLEKNKVIFNALLIEKDKKKIDKLEIKNEKEADEILEKIKNSDFIVSEIKERETTKNPFPPFITATLQQAAFLKFRWSAKQTIRIAQSLFEKGFITYHRTDSFHLSQDSLTMAKEYILKNLGENLWQKRIFKRKSKLSQEAHEAIRPTDVFQEPNLLKESLEKREKYLYELIWQRFLACQMKSAVFKNMKVKISASNFTFLAQGQSLKFEGFLKVYPIKREEKILPELKINEKLNLKKIEKKQHFTQPPARYNDASLIKEMEKNGIGRPSTYAFIISILQERNYVQKDEKKRFFPTEIGFLVSDLLREHFSEIINLKFTANMEDDLDQIANGKKEKVKVLKNFYYFLEEKIKQKEKEVSKTHLPLSQSEKKCKICQAPLVLKFSRYGKFYSCSRFPECKYLESLEKQNIGVQCPKCQGEILRKRTKKGKIFYGCENYPQCDFALWEKPLNQRCPLCNHLLIETKKGEKKCSNKNCQSSK